MALSFIALMATGCVPAVVVGGTAAGYYVGQDERTLNEIVDDASITASINAKYVKDPMVSSWDVNVDTRFGVVTLYGTVSGGAVEQRAIEIAQNTKGVKKIISKMTIVERQ